MIRDPSSNVLTVQENVIGYFAALKNITQINNQYLTNTSTDTAVATAILQVILLIRALSSAVNHKADKNLNSNIQALGAFVNPQWDPIIYQNLVSADIISREINGLWRTQGSDTPYFLFSSMNAKDA